MVGLFIGHITCGPHMTDMEIIVYPIWESYLESEVTTIHYLSQCPAFGRMRLRILGLDVIRMVMDSVQYLSLAEILRFGKSMQRLGYELSCRSLKTMDRFIDKCLG